MNFPSSNLAGRTVARILLEIEAIHIRPQQPFTLTSGRLSPVYIDCRKIIAFPRARRKIMDLAVDLIEQKIGFECFDAIAGGETAGIPFAAWIAERFALPMMYVRKQAKGFGKKAQIEGDIKNGWRCLLVEDLASDGGSKINFVNALRQAEAIVKDIFVIFYYDIFPASQQRLQEMDVKLHHLATWWDVLEYVQAEKLFNHQDIAAIKNFLTNPEQWTPNNSVTSHKL
ncbi:MAG: orotate phosphoribosyltransferase [Alphaproteobacteria bacterium]|nr:orotate phosphoribosyltransferase [Alphaproteobacteria bacterium]